MEIKKLSKEIEKKTFYLSFLFCVVHWSDDFERMK